jgi:hypothetical protein
MRWLRLVNAARQNKRENSAPTMGGEHGAVKGRQNQHSPGHQMNTKTSAKQPDKQATNVPEAS